MARTKADAKGRGGNKSKKGKSGSRKEIVTLGPKMGPRPPDFDEDMVRSSPSFQKWMTLRKGEVLRYAGRPYVKDRPYHEERLMRRIMITRRNNIKDHDTLKEARAVKALTTISGNNVKKKDGSSKQLEKPSSTAASAAAGAPGAGNDTEDDYAEDSDYSDDSSDGTEGRASNHVSDKIARIEMDVDAVEATRSYKAWKRLPVGQEFVYNQTYVKGAPNHDWLLRKNIWRRMRYRRRNRAMLQTMQLTRTSVSKNKKMAPQGESVQEDASQGDFLQEDESPGESVQVDASQDESVQVDASQETSPSNIDPSVGVIHIAAV